MKVASLFTRSSAPKTIEVPPLGVLRSDIRRFGIQDEHAPKMLRITRLLFGDLDDMYSVTSTLPEGVANPLHARLLPIITGIMTRELDKVPNMPDYKYKNWHLPTDERRIAFNRALENGWFAPMQLIHLSQSAVGNYAEITRTQPVIDELFAHDLASGLKDTLDTVRELVPVQERA